MSLEFAAQTAIVVQMKSVNLSGSFFLPSDMPAKVAIGLPWVVYLDEGVLCYLRGIGVRHMPDWELSGHLLHPSYWFNYLI